MELEAIFLQGFQRTLVALFNNTAYLFINFLGSFLRAGEGRSTAKVSALLLGKGNHAELIGHAILRNHGTGNACGALNIIGGSVGHLTENELLGGTSTAKYRNFIHGFASAHEVLLVIINLHGEAQRA